MKKVANINVQFIFLECFIILFLPRNSRYFVQISLLACRGLAYHDDDILSTMTQNCIGKKGTNDSTWCHLYSFLLKCTQNSFLKRGLVKA